MGELPGRNTVKRAYSPAMWEDADGNLHVSVPGLLAEVGLPDTPENRAIAREAAEELFREHGAGVVVARQSPGG